MPVVREVRVTKDYPEHGVKRGDVVYRWTTRHGRSERVDRMSKTPPRQSELTGSEYRRQMYQVQEAIEDYEGEVTPEEMVRWIRGQLQEVRERLESAIERVPHSLRSGPVATLNYTRLDYVEELSERVASVHRGVDSVRDLVVRVR